MVIYPKVKTCKFTGAVRGSNRLNACEQWARTEICKYTGHRLGHGT